MPRSLGRAKNIGSRGKGEKRKKKRKKKGGKKGTTAPVLIARNIISSFNVCGRAARQKGRKDKKKKKGEGRKKGRVKDRGKKSRSDQVTARS